MGASSGDDAYSIPTLARLLHSLPHLNVTLHRVNSTFDPQSPVYLEVRNRKINNNIETSAILLQNNFSNTYARIFTKQILHKNL